MLRTPRIKATIRHLATHTSGLAYEFWCAEETAHLQAIGSGGVLAASKLQTTLLNDYPMITEPGTRWAYGVSIDWLGLVVEAVSGMKIMDFLRANLLDPLGMKDTDAIVRDDMKDRLASVNLRGVNGSFTVFPVDPPATSDTFGMGHALYSTARDYAKFLRMILNKGELDGQRVLSASAVAQLLADQTPTGLVFREAVTTSPLSANFNPHPEVPKSHAFAFLRFDADVHGARRAGSVGWAGVCNSHYWIDPSSGIAGLFMTQTLPFAEAPYMVAYEAFERAAYA
jgi:CubicO group peptidase (beta-lactamase class C family)